MSTHHLAGTRLCTSLCCAVLVLLATGGASPCHAQFTKEAIKPFLVKSMGWISLRLRDGRVMSGHAELASPNSLEIVGDDGTARTFAVCEIAELSDHDMVIGAPDYISLSNFACCDRIFPWYFGEVRALAVKGEDLYFGGECAAGVRFGQFSLGIGGGAVSIKNVLRVPVFVHAKYHFSLNCINPYLFGDAGYPFDKWTSKYGEKIGFNGSAMAGAGLGIDYAIGTFIDLSLDAGYRYYRVNEEVLAPACTAVYVNGKRNINSAFVRFGVSF